LPGDARAGDTLTVTDGVTVNTIVLTAAQISAGTLATSFARPAEGGTINVSARITDTAGNSGASSAPDTAVIDSSLTTAGPDAFVAPLQSPLVIAAATLLMNDRGALGNPLSITSVQGAVNGTVALINGQVVFTPTPGFTGAASFTYTVTDSLGGSATALVSVTVPADDTPLASDNRLIGTPPVTITEPLVVTDPALHVLYSVNDVRVDTGLRGNLGIFQTDAATLGELTSEQALALDTLTAPRGFDGLVDSHLRGNGIGMQNSLFVQHAVRHEALVSEAGIFVQNSVRASQLESLARNIRVSSFNAAVPAVASLLDSFSGTATFATGTNVQDQSEQQPPTPEKPAATEPAKDSPASDSNRPLKNSADTSNRLTGRRAADGFAMQLRRNANTFRTSATRPETPVLQSAPPAL
jgi:YD repeat-containing protein